MTRTLTQSEVALQSALDRAGVKKESLQGWNPADGGMVSFAAKIGGASEVDILKRMSEQNDLPLFRVTKSNFTELLSIISELNGSGIDNQFWRENNLVPVKKSPRLIEVAALNPFDTAVTQALKYRLQCSVQTALIPEDELMALLDGRLAASQDLDFNTLLKDSGQGRRELEVARFESSTISATGDAPVIQAVNKILGDGIRAQASDIHINAGQGQTKIKIRVDGMLRDLCNFPSEAHSALISRLKLLAGMDIAEKRKPQDGRLRIKTPLGTRDLRLASVPTLYGENLVIRIQNGDVRKIQLNELGIDPDSRLLIEEALKGSSRVVIVSGPTGSGKTSTLYGGIVLLNDGKKNIVTIEDPIEHRIAGINQTQVNHKIGVGFAEGLRSMLRQDPDVIMVGEIRDTETATIAMQAAQTGHLVLSTLHANSAPAALTRLYDLGLAPYLVASSLGAVVAQRLVRKLCPQCKEKRDEIYTAGRGCDECSGTGYRGRIGIYSVLPITDAVRELIRNGGSESAIEEAGMHAGYRSLEEKGLALLTDGVTSLEELERVLGPVSHKTEGPGAPPPPGMGRRKLLLVEDDESVRTVMGMLFEREFYDVTEAEHGLDALDKIYQSMPDVIVSDLMMPKCDGLKFLKKIRSDSRLKHIPVLMLTAANSEDNELTLLEYGANDFVPKSSDARILLKRVERLITGQ